MLYLESIIKEEGEKPVVCAWSSASAPSLFPAVLSLYRWWLFAASEKSPLCS
jgi:hypothetical protein